MIPSMDSPVPNAAAAKITERGPKNTKQNVATPSANQFRGFTNSHQPREFPYKRFDLVLINPC